MEAFMRNIILSLLTLLALISGCATFPPDDREKQIVDGQVEQTFHCPTDPALHSLLDPNHLHKVPDPYCLTALRIRFTNNSKSYLSQITFKIIIRSNNLIVYKQDHTVDVDIDEGLTVPYQIDLIKKAEADRRLRYGKFFTFEIVLISYK